ncbi:MAG: response regulator [Deltaproteobacteria bacterium]|nr:response regulator [Deltaproteobacteria bacterium]
MTDNNTPIFEQDEIRKVLIVDDEEDFVLSLIDILEPYGYMIEKANSGKEATDKIKGFDAHVALLDIRLGKESGISLIYKLREASPSLLPIVMTAYTEADTAIEALQEGAYDYLRKPFNPHDLLATLERCFEKLKLEREKSASDERYRLLVETMNDGLGVQDRDGLFTFANKKLCEMTGYSKDELIGRSMNDLLDKKNRKLYQEYSEKALSENSKPYELELLRRNGETLSVLVSPQVIKKSDGTSKGLFAVITDISERKEADERKKEMESQLQQAQRMESIGTLAGGISHDFNNSLQAILGYTQMILLDTEESDSKYPRLIQIEKAARRAIELTQQLLAFSRKVESRFRPVDLNQEIKHVEKLLQRTIPKMINIVLDLEEDLNIISADPTQIEQILMNLAVNARDAMGDEGTIKIETRNITLDEEYCKSNLGVIPGNYVLLVLSDTGHGMDQKTIERIFEPFFTTKEPGKGTGLGLSMVYGLVKKHHGHITCHSEPEQGSSFKIFIPAVIDSDPGVPVEAENDLTLGGDEVILIIDDDPLVRDLGEQILTKFGYKVLTAINGESGIQKYLDKKEIISLIILDLMMPGMGGKRCLKEILRLEPNTKVIIASGYSEDGHVDATIESGAKSSIKKPFDIKQMLSVVRKVLDAEEQ